jgi:hypothetical protein
VIAASGAYGKRFATENSTLLIHQPRSGGSQEGGMKHEDSEDTARYFREMRQRLDVELAWVTGRRIQEVRELTSQEVFLTALQAQEFGLIDDIYYCRPEAAPHKTTPFVLRGKTLGNEPEPEWAKVYGFANGYAEAAPEGGLKIASTPEVQAVTDSRTDRGVAE